MKTIALLAGARPNYMKIFPLWRDMTARRAGRMRPVIIHTGQHYDPLMNDVFFSDLGMPKPDHFLGIGSGSHGLQTGKTMIALDELLQSLRPDCLVVVGDVNSTMAGALVAVKLGVPVAHVEAGLRSNDRTMPEEINRIVTDSVSDLLFTHSPDADENLLREGIDSRKIHRVGNVMIDTLTLLLDRARQSRILETLGIAQRPFVLVTLHRPSNVDHSARLLDLMRALEAISAELPVILPLHPRTRRMLAASNYHPHAAGLRLIDPLGYLDFLRLEADAALVVTDSGGVQEETTFLGVPCLTLRAATERPITLTQGTNRLYRPNLGSIDRAALDMLREARRVPRIEGWDGHAAERILDALENLL